MRGHRTEHEPRGGIDGKPCARCGDWLPLICYPSCSRSWDGLDWRCRDCRRAEVAVRDHAISVARRRRGVLSRERVARWARESSPLELGGN